MDPLNQLLPEGIIQARRGQRTMLLNFTEQAQHLDVSGQSVTVPSKNLVILAR